MIMNELNTNLIEAAKEKFPAKGQLANILMDTLYMGKEAIYRRLRGEVPFTFQEAAIISKELLKPETYLLEIGRAHVKRTGDIPGQNCRS